MTTREARGLMVADTEEESIAQYLQRNPEFFERHLPLLARLRLPHVRDGGSTISLVERQIEVLREKQAALEGKLAELVRVARANDAISERLHRFTRRLLRGVPRAQAIAHIEAGLREDFDAFHAALVLIDAPADPQLPSFVRTVAASDPNLKSFESLFASGKPRCGQARDSQREFLFGPEGLQLGSVALVPLGDKGAIGLLALGSADRDRFHPGMSTEFLARLADLITDALSAAR
jgi:uncharacterized protein